MSRVNDSLKWKRRYKRDVHVYKPLVFIPYLRTTLGPEKNFVGNKINCMQRIFILLELNSDVFLFLREIYWDWIRLLKRILSKMNRFRWKEHDTTLSIEAQWFYSPFYRQTDTLIEICFNSQWKDLFIFSKNFGADENCYHKVCNCNWEHSHEHIQSQCNKTQQ